MITLSDLAEDFLDSSVQCTLRNKGFRYSQATIANRTISIRKYVIPILGEVTLNNLQPEHVYKLTDFALGVGPSCAQDAIVTLRQILKLARRRGHTIPFDWRDVDIPYCKVKRPVTYLTIEEIREVRRAIDQMPVSKYRNRAMFEIALHSGLRIGEVIRLQKSDVDIWKETVTFKNIKTGEPEHLPIFGASIWVQAYMARRTDNSPSLFVSYESFGRGEQAKALTSNAAKTVMREIRAKLRWKHKHLSWHVVRKTFCTHLLRNTDIKTVQRLARHKSERTTLKHYAAVEMERAVEEHKRIMENL